MRKTFSLFFSLSRLVSTRNESRMIFFSFLDFFAIFLGILSHGLCKNGYKREKKFLSFSTCPDPFWLEMKAGCCFLFFLNFFRNSQARVGKKRFLTRKCFSLYFNLARLVLAGNEARMMFLSFFAIVFGIF